MSRGRDPKDVRAGPIPLDDHGWWGACTCTKPLPPEDDPLSDAEIAALAEVAKVFGGIIERLCQRGYFYENGILRPPQTEV